MKNGLVIILASLLVTLTQAQDLAVPQGFDILPIPEIGWQMLKPKDWLCVVHHNGDHLTLCVYREPQPAKGLNGTGISILIFSRLTEMQKHLSPSQYVLRTIEESRASHQIVSMEPLTVYGKIKRFAYSIDREGPVDKSVEYHYSICDFACDETDTLIEIRFGCPRRQWKKGDPIWKTINPSIDRNLEAKREVPNQAAEPRRAAVTAPAGAGARASGAPGSP